MICVKRSNDSHQCPILAADLLWDRKWTAYLYPSLTSRPCLDGFFIFYPIIKNNKVSCEYGTLMWIIAVHSLYLSFVKSKRICKNPHPNSKCTCMYKTQAITTYIEKCYWIPLDPFVAIPLFYCLYVTKWVNFYTKIFNRPSKY